MVVYNHKRHGDFKLGGKTYSFQAKYSFPKKTTPEFLLVDLLNNLNNVAEDPMFLMKNVEEKVKEMDPKKLKKAVKEYGGARAKSFFTPLLKNVGILNGDRLSS